MIFVAVRSKSRWPDQCAAAPVMTSSAPDPVSTVPLCTTIAGGLSSADASDHGAFAAKMRAPAEVVFSNKRMALASGKTATASTSTDSPSGYASSSA